MGDQLEKLFPLPFLTLEPSSESAGSRQPQLQNSTEFDDGLLTLFLSSRLAKNESDSH